MVSPLDFLTLLADGGDRDRLDQLVEDADSEGVDALTLSDLPYARESVRRVWMTLDASRRRESELAALYETAGELAARSDLDSLLEAIVGRLRRLLQSDLAWMSLVDEATGDSYTTITSDDTVTGSVSRSVRVPVGDGLAGLVTTQKRPFVTDSYFEDDRINHTAEIDAVVRENGLVALLGVPLLLEGRVLGVLLAGNRTRRPFSGSDIALVSSLAAHAAVGLERARMLQEARERTRIAERAALAHDRFTALALEGHDVDAVAIEVRALLNGEVAIIDADHALISETSPAVSAAIKRLPARDLLNLESGDSADGVCWVPVVAGADRLGTIVLLCDAPLDVADQRILERAAQVTALLLLFRRSLAASEERLRGELLEDIFSARHSPGLEGRARRAGIDPSGEHVLLVVDATDARSRLSAAGALLAVRRRGLSAVRDGDLVLVVPADAPDAAASAWEEFCLEARSTVTAGMAGPAQGLEALAPAYTEARTCLRAAVAMGYRGRLAALPDLGFLGVLLGKGPDAESFAQEVLEPVLNYDEEHSTDLVGSLRAYFANSGNLKETAHSLHIHHKTVAQRLERLGTLLGEDWRTPDKRLQIELAVHIHYVHSEVTRGTTEA